MNIIKMKGVRKTFEIKDYGPRPLIVNIDKVALLNDNFRTAIWTGTHLQVTLMSIKVGQDIGVEIHHSVDQLIVIVSGEGLVKMGNSKDNLDYQQKVSDNFAIMVPAGKWHNVVNTGTKPLKLFSVYAPPQHPRGTVQKTKEEAQAAERLSAD